MPEPKAEPKKYDPKTHDTKEALKAVFCPFSQKALVVDEARGCGSQCQFFIQKYDVVVNRQMPAEKVQGIKAAGPVTIPVKTGERIVCGFPVHRDVNAVEEVVLKPEAPAENSQGPAGA